MMERMPVLFVGHGSPMNAIEKNQFTDQWEALGKMLPRPKAILSVSAHWYTAGSRVTDSPAPRTVYDMYGFPEELYKIVYGAPGAPEIAHRTQSLLTRPTEIDNTWGIDHGTWSVLHRVYPAADIPLFQLSVDKRAPLEAHYQLGQALRPLREEGVLIFGSGNVVHNLGRVAWDMKGGYPWAEEFDHTVKDNILAKNHEKLFHLEQLGPAAALSVPYPDHYAPLLYILGASDAEDRVSVFNDECVLGSLSMTSFLFQ